MTDSVTRAQLNEMETRLMTAIQTLAGSKDELENRLIAEINRLREESKDTYEGFKNRVDASINRLNEQDRVTQGVLENLNKNISHEFDGEKGRLKVLEDQLNATHDKMINARSKSEKRR